MVNVYFLFYCVKRSACYLPPHLASTLRTWIPLHVLAKWLRNWAVEWSNLPSWKGHNSDLSTFNHNSHAIQHGNFSVGSFYCLLCFASSAPYSLPLFGQPQIFPTTAKKKQGKLPVNSFYFYFTLPALPPPYFVLASSRSPQNSNVK